MAISNDFTSNYNSALDINKIKEENKKLFNSKEAKQKKDVYGKDTFLKLFVAQMQHQDPLEPLKNEDFIAQMAQFSSVEQITNLASSFEKFAKKYEQNSAKPDAELKKINENLEKIAEKLDKTDMSSQNSEIGKFIQIYQKTNTELINKIAELEQEIKNLKK